MFLGCMLAAIPLFLTPNQMGQPDVTKAPYKLCSHQHKYMYCIDDDNDRTYFFNTSLQYGYKPGDACWIPDGDETKKQGDANHEYRWMCGCTKATDCRPEGSKDQAPHTRWPVVVGYMIYGFFVGPIL